MPSKTSLTPTQTVVSIHEANPGETSVSHRRLSFLKQMNGLWKGMKMLQPTVGWIVTYRVYPKVLDLAQRSS